MKTVSARIVLAILAISVHITSNAQEPSTTPTITLKAYAKGSLTYDKFHITATQTEPGTKLNTCGFSAPAFALNIQKPNGIFSEYELSDVHITRTDYASPFTDTAGRIVTQTSHYSLFGLNLRYERGWQLWKQSTKKLKYFISGGIQTGFSVASYKPHNSPFSVQSVSSSVTCNWQVIPRIQYPLGNRFLLDVNTPFNLCNMYFSRRVAQSTPVSNSPMETTTEQDIKTFPKQYSLRIGLVYKI